MHCDEHRFDFRRRTYHTPRADATYEQCPWSREHVEAIYRNLQGLLVEDGQWHDFPPLPESVGRYRVSGQYFQAVFASSPNAVFEALASMEPVETGDDAEWEIWSLSTGDGYGLSSTFATTPGPFAHQDTANDWLERHGLGLEVGATTAEGAWLVEGVAYFEELEPGCVRDAMERLAWLEQALDDLNGRIEQLSEEFWRELQPESDAMAEKYAASLGPDEIIPVPERYVPEGVKQRMPL